MAVNDVVVYNEAKAYLIDGGFEPADSIKIALFTSTYVPTPAEVGPVYSITNEVTSAGSYTAGGIALDTLGVMVTETTGTMTFDTATDPSWTQNGSNGVAAWGMIYNATDGTTRAIAYVELGSVDMSAGSLTITWNAAGIFTIT